MSDDATRAGHSRFNETCPLPPWPECEVFCIHSYAGEAGSPCGWRGKTGDGDLCPRCGRPTLLPIPPAIDDPCA